MLYEFSVFARNEQGNGSAIVLLWNVSIISPRAAPDAVTVTPENMTHVLVSWSELSRSETGGGLTGYRVLCYANPLVTSASLVRRSSSSSMRTIFWPVNSL